MNVYEDLFFSPAERAAETRVALDALSEAVPLANPEVLANIASRDRRFARAIRRAVSSGALEFLDYESLRSNVAGWGLDGVRLRAGQVAVDPSGTARWQFLRLLGDDLLISSATGRRYEVNSKREWSRRIVERIAVTHGMVVAVASSQGWGSVSATDAIREIEQRDRVYYMLHEEYGVLLLSSRLDQGAQVLWAGPDDGPNLLLSLPSST